MEERLGHGMSDGSAGEAATFDELARRYNFLRTEPFARVFTRLVINECRDRERPVRALDIGCGRGIAGNLDLLRSIRAEVDELWGVEPDESTEPPEGVFDRHEHAVVERADLPQDHFDVAYSSMVMEHVVDPDAFMQAVCRSLRPGGAYLFITPNRRHFFTRTALTLHRLRLDELVLRLVKKREKVEDYHYPVQYRFNDERRIGACARRLGLPEPEYAYVEQTGAIGYFPGPLRPVYHLLVLKRKLIRNPRTLIHLVCRMRKPV